MTGISIYRKIALRTGKKGWLPAGFTLFGESSPGEADARLLYDSQAGELGYEAFDEFLTLLKNACDNANRKNDGAIAEYLKRNHILRLIDKLCEEIYYYDSGIDLILLLDAAFGWATASRDMNLVKLGISLMGMLNVGDREDCRKAIITLGKYEEFTLYSLYAVSEWADADRIALDYARNLKGWGKKHAELMLAPEAI